MAVPQYQKAVEHARSAEALTLMAAMSESTQRYHDQHESWPASIDLLDVEVPRNGDCTSGFGGGNFCLSITSENTQFQVHADRHTANENNAYQLQTTITVDDTNGTYSVARQCTTQNANAQKYCDIITGGKADF